MTIVQLTPGAGGMFCGGCLRDNALALALRKQGHDVLMVPLYLPLTVDEPDQSNTKVFFGGINVFLQQKSSLFRKAGGLLDRVLDDPGMLKFATRFGIQTDPGDLGALTVSMLRGEDGHQKRELDKLTTWLRDAVKPDVICLSNALLMGMAKRLHDELNAPVVCTLQGEDYFVDNLPIQFRADAWSLLKSASLHVAGFIAVSQYYGDVMAERMGVPREKIHVVHNGIELDGYGLPDAPPPHEGRFPPPQTVGYFARMSPEKGLATFLDAFIALRRDNQHANVRAIIAGSLTAADEAFVAAQKKKLAAADLTHEVSWHPSVSRAEKIALLQRMSLFSVPATYGEAFGLYILEALACGVPVVQPRHGAFPELLERTGGGILVAPDDPKALAEAWAHLLGDPAKRSAMGKEGHARVNEHYHIHRAAKDVADVFERVKRGI